jgi:hypothetical protein
MLLACLLAWDVGCVILVSEWTMFVNPVAITRLTTDHQDNVCFCQLFYVIAVK